MDSCVSLVSSLVSRYVSLIYGLVQDQDSKSSPLFFSQIFETRCNTSALNCCSFINDTTIACGTHDGHLFFWDIRNPRTALEKRVEFRSSFLSIQPFSETNTFVATTGTLIESKHFMSMSHDHQKLTNYLSFKLTVLVSLDTYQLKRMIHTRGILLVPIVIPFINVRLIVNTCSRAVVTVWYESITWSTSRRRWTTPMMLRWPARPTMFELSAPFVDERLGIYLFANKTINSWTFLNSTNSHQKIFLHIELGNSFKLNNSIILALNNKYMSFILFRLVFLSKLICIFW